MSVSGQQDARRKRDFPFESFSELCSQHFLSRDLYGRRFVNKTPKLFHSKTIFCQLKPIFCRATYVFCQSKLICENTSYQNRSNRQKSFLEIPSLLLKLLTQVLVSLINSCIFFKGCNCLCDVDEVRLYPL